MDYISVCMTFKDRNHFLNDKFINLYNQDYDSKKIEICITEDIINDDTIEIIKKWAKYFYQIKYARSNRGVLPFDIVSNNPACDYNSQMVNQATFEKIIRTDAEVLFTRKESLRFIDDILNSRNNLIYHISYHMPEDYKINNSEFSNNFEGGEIYRSGNAYCYAINKSDFIKYGGFDERFALGFAGEDSYFIDWYKKNQTVSVSPYPVIHLWHPSPCNSESLRLRKEYTIPLLLRLREENALPNFNNPDWTRVEMLSNNLIFKG